MPQYSASVGNVGDLEGRQLSLMEWELPCNALAAMECIVVSQTLIISVVNITFATIVPNVTAITLVTSVTAVATSNDCRISELTLM
jgi:hypothetical protein